MTHNRRAAAEAEPSGLLHLPSHGYARGKLTAPAARRCAEGLPATRAHTEPVSARCVASDCRPVLATSLTRLNAAQLRPCLGCRRRRCAPYSSCSVLGRPERACSLLYKRQGKGPDFLALRLQGEASASGSRVDVAQFSRQTLCIAGAHPAPQRVPCCSLRLLPPRALASRARQAWWTSPAATRRRWPRTRMATIS